MPVRFGATVVQVVPFPLLRDDFVFAESIGLDNAWVIDQFGIDGVPEVALLEAWTTLAALARETKFAGAFSDDVLPLAERPFFRHISEWKKTWLSAHLIQDTS